jgi:apolipoprotein D and lipocalin family protein
MKIALALLLAGGFIMSTSCSSIPEGAKPVDPFDSMRYLGMWYEIARFDFKFEKNMNNTKAEYSLNNDGTIRVENSGFDYITNKQKRAIGKAKFIKSKSVGQLKVSFFGPFYGAYNIIMIDTDYKYALIAGKNLNYLWILSRERTIPKEIKDRYISEARKIGYNTDKLIWVEHNQQK